MLQLFSTKTDLVSRKFDDEANENETKKKKKKAKMPLKNIRRIFSEIFHVSRQLRACPSEINRARIAPTLVSFAVIDTVMS